MFSPVIGDYPSSPQWRDGRFHNPRGHWLLPIHNGTFDLAMHVWRDPFEQVLRIADERGVRVATPMFGERVDMNAPREGARWWRTRDGLEGATAL